MKCALCGYVFSEDKKNFSCKSCFIAKGCRLIRCPNCGYENPEEPQWLKKIKKRRKKNGINRQG